MPNIHACVGALHAKCCGKMNEDSATDHVGQDEGST